jgi:hypothetical protein
MVARILRGRWTYVLLHILNIRILVFLLFY